MTLLDDLDLSLSGITVDERDRAAVSLARLLALQIDADPALAERLGSKLTTLLVQLQLTPASRKGAKTDEPDESDAALAEVVELHAAG